MEHLPEYYTTLFNAVTDALVALQEHNHTLAQQLLITGQQKAEEAYMTTPHGSPAGKG